MPLSPRSSPRSPWVAVSKWGRDPLPGERRLGPVDQNWIYPDPNVDRIVSLAIYYPKEIGTPKTGWHWALIWNVGTFPDESGKPVKRDYVRVIELVVDPGRSEYTYWGPMTKALGEETKKAKIIPISTLSLSERQHLQECALRATVYKANGEFNCQTWLWEVLRLAIEEDIFLEAEVENIPRR